MLQNTYNFNQSSVELEIIGLPDYSKDDNEKNISIISSWKLSIINKPEIQGNLDHLKCVIKAFYTFATTTLLERNEKFESDFIDISLDKEGKFNLLLKSSKPGIKPLTIKLGSSEFADIINCIDQLKVSDNIKLDFNELDPVIKKKNIYLIEKHKIIESLLSPLLAIFSISMFTLASTFFYENRDERNNNISLALNNKSSNTSSLVIIIK